LPKAFQQIRKILDVLSTPRGTEFLVERIRSLDPDPFDEGFVPLHPVIVTSENSGMFFSRESAEIDVIDYRELTHILDNSDGDVTYVTHMLKNRPRQYSAKLQKVEQKVEVENLRVTYEAAAMESPLWYPPHEWRSTGLDKQIAEDFFKNGGSRTNPFDEKQ
jgi:hypothetical protein